MSQHIRKMQKQHIYDSLCGLDYSLVNIEKTAILSIIIAEI